MQTKSLPLIGLIALAITPLHGQSSQPVYWSTTVPDCSSLLGETAIPVKNGSATVGYSCFVGGTFVWFAAGGVWGTSLRVAAPASAAVAVNYSFYDTTGNNVSLDTTIDNDQSSFASGNQAKFALFANQPAEIEILGATSDNPSYSHTADGTVFAVFLCPDAMTCASVLPQLIYSALPTYPWSLSVPIAWDFALAKQWSAEGIDDGRTNVVSLVVYNEDVTATSYKISVFDGDGNLAGTGTTPSIPPLSSGSVEGGTYAALLSDLVSPLPQGIFKVLIDGGSSLSAVEVLQINGASATTLQVAPDTAPATASGVMARQKSSERILRAQASKELIRPLRKKSLAP